MASGLTHFWISGLLAFSLMLGGIFVDLDHWSLFGGSHNITQLWKGFLGKNYIHSERDDSSHPFHQSKVYNTIFLIIACMVMFGIGYFLHLRLDKIL